MSKLFVSLLVLGMGQLAMAEYPQNPDQFPPQQFGENSYGGQGFGGRPYPGPVGQPFPGQPGGFDRGRGRGPGNGHRPFPQPMPRQCLPFIQASTQRLEQSMYQFAQLVSRYERQGQTERAALNAAQEIRNFGNLVARTCCDRTARENLPRVHWSLDHVERSFRSCHLGSNPQLGFAFQQTVIAWHQLQQAVNR